MVSRRRLIGGAGALLATGAVFGTTGPGQRLLDQLPMFAPAQPLDRTPMAGHIGERFVTHVPEHGRVALTLELVGNLPGAPSGSEGQFVARFGGPASAPLAQSTYRFATSSFGDVDVFVVPGTTNDPAVLSYTAVFNRLEEVA
jgi:hypothetical protein